MNHLDIGFDGISPTIGYAYNVIHKVLVCFFVIFPQYWYEFFPAAIVTAEELRARGGSERLIYTSHAYLISLFLDCDQVKMAPLNLTCPSSLQKAVLEAAIVRGDIAYHAFPHNSEPEVADEALFRFGIQLAHSLDQRFGFARRTVLSQRDVPGMTRAVVPYLVAEGVEAITIGVNLVSAPPAVPDVFVWSDMASNTSVIGMLHPGGYGGIGIADCVMVPGLSHALAFAIRLDNSGPPDSAEVLGNFAQLRREFPNSHVMASTYDAFVSELQTVRHKLPVYTEEIGDTWIYGVSSDPFKLAALRVAMRQRTAAIALDPLLADDVRLWWFNRFLLKLPEHTWGCDTATNLKDFMNWTNAQFAAVRNGENFRIMEHSWDEQRQYLYSAIDALGDLPLASAIRNELSALHPQQPALTGYKRMAKSDLARPIDTGRLELAFDATNGAIIGLHDKHTGSQWASATHALGYFQYQTVSAKDYDNFLDQYLYCDLPGPSETCPVTRLVLSMDFGKPNLDLSQAESSLTVAALNDAWINSEDSLVTRFLMHLRLSDHLIVNYGAPRDVWLSIAVATNSSEIALDVLVFNKTTTRMPESLWLSFNAQIKAPFTGWTVDKMGQAVSPYQVVNNGSAHMHALGQQGLVYHGVEGVLNIVPLDAPLVSAGPPTPFPEPMVQPDYSQGWHFNLYNNIWGTNYIMWYPWRAEDASILYRFVVTVA
eukprot:TRINITY_DN1960_c0_g1_i5.p1 TRINITY_DN1960_c0_g1~~TRINITY_DN1960_c0_g1_i5.p1  ORF type:complete len:711 (-),score=103.27 TRINITY_DN1960_c0_g1_i5:35-2167(-)